MKKVLDYPLLNRNFYANEDCAAVVQQLLGKILVVHKEGELRAGRIVETEAYLGPHDLAAHTSKEVTRRNQAMGIDRSDYGMDLCVPERIYLLDGPSVKVENIIAKPRVGVDYAGEWALKPLRFYDGNSAYISRK